MRGDFGEHRACTRPLLPLLAQPYPKPANSSMPPHIDQTFGSLCPQVVDNVGQWLPQMAGDKDLGWAR
jgi:hypothetical protein